MEKTYKIISEEGEDVLEVVETTEKTQKRTYLKSELETQKREIEELLEKFNE